MNSKKIKAGTPVHIDGTIFEVRKLFTRIGQKPMASFTIESPEGLVDAVAFPEAYAKFDQFVEPGTTASFEGATMENDGDRLKLQILEIKEGRA